MLLSSRSGDFKSNDFVLVNAQTISSFEKPPPGTAFASSAAFELRKNSVPSAWVLKRLSGDRAGQTVKPGWTPVDEFTASTVSNWTTVTVCLFSARSSLGKA